MAGEDERHLRERLSRLRGLPLLRGARLRGDLDRFKRQLDRIEAQPSEETWRLVELARHSQRPYTLDYVERLFDDFVELHGDRARAEDPALITGLGRFNGRTVAIIGQQKGRDLGERQKRNFGMPHPEGYRKGMRLMEIAQRHGFPIVTFLDSPGAYPGVAAEQHGQGGAIARSQALMARLTIPLVACIIGEGNSGGAIAIGLVDRVLMQEYAIYSVISPEGCAAILWRDGAEKVKAAVALQPDAAALPESRRDRRHRARAQGRRAPQPRRGGAQARRVSRRHARPAFRASCRASPSATARALPADRRL